MAVEAQLTLQSDRIAQAATVAGDEPTLWSALQFAQRTMSPGDLLRLRDMLAKPEHLHVAVQEIVTHWRQVHMLTGCDDPAAPGGNVTTPSPEANP